MTEQIRLIEELAMNAWPAELIEPLDGWWMRWHRMTSRRVNSVWPNAWGGQLPLAIKLEKVEQFYMLREQPARYQICPAALPEGLDGVLEARGYTVDAVTAVQIAKSAVVVARTGLFAPPSGYAVRIYETLTDEWLEGYCLAQDVGVENVPPRRATLQRIKVPSVYISASVNGTMAAVGRGVLERGWLGVFGMSTRSEYRRRGLATQILGTLAGWAQMHDAEQMYLQVMEINPSAKRLYEKLGFKTLYHYHYRQQPRNSV